MKREPKTRNRRAYTEAEKAALIAAFDARKAAGDVAAKAAANADVPIANVFRWKSNARRKYFHEEVVNQLSLLGQAFSVLFDGPKAHKERYFEALFILISWLRCSNRPESLQLGVATLLIATARAKFGVDKLSEVPAPWLKMIARHISLSNFVEICCLTGPEESLPEFPDFWNGVLEDQPYDDRDELARMCWCLLALGHTFAGRSASLGKTIYLMNSDEFRYRWKVSRRTKESFWKKHAATSPFVFVERFYSPLDLSLDPQADDLLQKVDDLLSQHGEVRDFLRKTRTVVERLMGVMDVRALQSINFPPFPDKIAPLDMKMPELTPSIMVRLRSYRSAGR